MTHDQHAPDPFGGLPIYHVVCPDDGIRHEAAFLTVADAIKFADNGHACLPLSAHRLTRWDSYGLHIIAMNGREPWEDVDDVLTVIVVSEAAR